MTTPNLLVILSLISFLSIILVTDSPLKSYTNFYENNNHILLKITPLYAQDNSGNFDDGDIFPSFEEGDNKGEEKGGGNEERINENTNDFSPLSSGSPINTDDKINPYGSPINPDDEVIPDDEVGQPVGQQSEQEAENPLQVDRQSGQQVDQQTVGNEVNQTEQQQDTGEQVDQQSGQQP